jgi:hypothetical protein
MSQAESHPGFVADDARIDAELVATMERLTDEMPRVDKETERPVSVLDDVVALLHALRAAFVSHPGPPAESPQPDEPSHHPTL